MHQFALTTLLIQNSANFAFLLAAAFLFLATNLLKSWIQKRTSRAHLYLGLSYTSLLIGNAQSLFWAVNTNRALCIDSHISFAHAFAALWIYLAHIQQTTHRSRSLFKSLFLSILGLAAFAANLLAPPIQSLLLSLWAILLFSMLLFANVSNTEVTENDSSTDSISSLRNIAVASIFFAITALVGITIQPVATTPEPINHFVRFSMFSAAEIFGIVPALFVQIKISRSTIKVLGANLNKSQQRIALLCVAILAFSIFLFVSNQIQNHVEQAQLKLSLIQIENTTKSLNEKLVFTKRISSLIRDEINFYQANNKQFSLQKTCEKIGLDCVIIEVGPASMPQECKNKLAQEEFCAYFTNNKKEQHTELVSITNLSHGTHPERNAHLVATTAIEFPQSNISNNVEQIFIESSANTVFSTGSITTPKFNSIPCEKNDPFPVWNTDLASTYPCMPYSGKNVFTQNGESAHLVAKNLNSTSAAVVQISKRSTSLAQGTLYILGSIIFVIVAAFLHAWNILGQLYRAAQWANERKTALVADISHELRNPISGISSVLEILMNSDANPKQYRLLKNAQAAVESMAQIVNEVSDYSTLESGKLEIEFREFELRKCVEQATSQLSYLACSKNLDFSMYIDDNVPEHVIGDPKKLAQVLTNLLSNALKYTEKGSVELRIQNEKGTENAHFLKFEVQDTGIGISSENIPLLFNRFSRVCGTSCTKVSGTGLGLNISKQLIQRFGGTLGVESELDKGSTFWFTIPITSSTKLAFWQNERDFSIPERQVLVVSAANASRKNLSKLLAGMGASIIESSETLHAIQLLLKASGENNSIHIVCIDEDSLDLPAHAFMKHVQQLKLPKMPTFVRIVRSQTQCETQAKKCDESDFTLVKPIGPRQIAMHFPHINAEKKIPESKPLLRSLSEAFPIRGGLRILVAEDNSVLQEIAVTQLEMLGCETAVAPNGEEAVRALNEKHFDLVLMDVRMPKMNGFEATKVIREREKSGEKHIPIVAMTGEAMSGDKEKCINAGMDDYISKPINLGELAKIIERQSRR